MSDNVTNPFFEDDGNNPEGVKLDNFALPVLSLDYISSGSEKLVLPEDSVDETFVSDSLDSFLDDGESHDYISEDLLESESGGDFTGDYNDDDLSGTLRDLMGDEGDDNDPLGIFESEFNERAQVEVDPLKLFNIDDILSDAIDAGASDVHVNPNDQVAFSILGEISRQAKYSSPDGVTTQRLQQNIISHVLEADFVNNLELDTSYVIRSGRHKGRRLRLSVGKTFNEIFMVFRIISDVIPSPADLRIDKELLDWAKLPNGLIMINGATGTGKSTTLASMLREIQLERNQKIITLERPIEYIFGNDGKALVTQREVGRDTRSFTTALTSTMRQAPDIIMVGEVRNRVEVNELLRAAETGHLTISTMHTNSVAITITRIKGLYEGDDQLRILSSLSDSLRGIANQVLLKSLDGKSRFAVREILTVNDEISQYIMNGDVKSIRNYQIEKGITMEHKLVEAVKYGRCSIMEARSKSAYPFLFDQLIDEDD